MSVAKITEIAASSPKSFDDAIKTGIARANKTLKHIRGAWVKDQKVVVEKGKIHGVPGHDESYVCAGVNSRYEITGHASRRTLCVSRTSSPSWASGNTATAGLG